MGYARHIGRVGALAVTLGVGAAIANGPAVAYADSTNPTGDTSTTDNKPKDETAATPDTATLATKDVPSSAADRRQQRRAALRSVAQSIQQNITKTIESAVSGNAVGARPSTAVNGTSTGSRSVAAEAKESSTARATSTRTRARANELAGVAEKVESAATNFTQRVEQAVQKYTAPESAGTTSPMLTTAPQTFTTAATSLLAPDPRPRTSVVPFFTNPLGALIKPLIYPGPDAPLQLPTLMAVFVAIRDEIERLLVPRSTQVAYPPRTDQPVDPGLPDPTKQHVLVIAVDGANLSEVLQEDDTPNTNFEELMSVSTVSAPSIVEHTSVSNPSWTAVLTGAWVERTGVDQHNTFTPWTYDRFPTVFTQLENYNPAIRTKQIGDWDVIGAISASGEGADEVVYIAPEPDDVEKIEADAAVTQATVDTLKTTIPESEVPNFMVTYLGQVDEAGHIYGGDSPEYDAALLRTDQNLGAILDAVAEREKPCEGGNTTGCGEEWTIIVVTDHGHQPQIGTGHGFQSPRETDTFVIVNGPQFDTPGCGTTCARFNPDYEIVDVTPTVLSLFGAPQPPVTDGVPLQSLNGSSSALLTQGELEDILEAQMATHDFPNIFVNVALAVRTISGVIPYFVLGSGLPSPLLEIAWIATNVPNQVVAFATGVYGARLFPILPPGQAIEYIPDQATSIETAFRTDCGSISLDPAGCIAA